VVRGIREPARSFSKGHRVQWTKVSLARAWPDANFAAHAMRAAAPLSVRSLTLSLLLCAFGGQAGAQLWNGPLRDSPARFFDDEDMRLFLEASRKALDDTPEHGTVAWENPATRHRGEFTVVSSFTWQDHPCRRLQIVTVARGEKGRTTLPLCRIEERWRAVSSSQLQDKGR
jgi:surface antigen